MATHSSSSGAARRVLADPDLLRHITVFKRGWPQALVDFWDAHFKLDDLAKNCDKDCKPSQLLRLLMRFGDPRLADLALGVQYWDCRGWWKSLSDHGGCFGYKAIKHGRVDMLEWSLGQQSSTSVSFMWQTVFESPPADAAMLDLIFTKFPFESRLRVLDRVKYPHVYVKHPNGVVLVKWITETLPNVVLPKETTDDAAQAGNLALVRYLHEHRAAEGCTSEAFQYATWQKHFDVLEYLLRHRREFFYPDLIRLAIGWNGLGVLTAIKDMGFPELLRGFEQTVHEMVWYNKSSYVLDWFIDNDIFAPASVSIDEFVGWSMDGVPEMVKRLHESGAACATTKAVDEACEVGQWGIVRFLLANRTEGFTQRALAEAEQAGNAEIVQLLHAYAHMNASLQEEENSDEPTHTAKRAKTDDTVVEKSDGAKCASDHSRVVYTDAIDGVTCV